MEVEGKSCDIDPNHHYSELRTYMNLIHIRNKLGDCQIEVVHGILPAGRDSNILRPENVGPHSW